MKLKINLNSSYDKNKYKRGESKDISDMEILVEWTWKVI